MMDGKGVDMTPVDELADDAAPLLSGGDDQAPPVVGSVGDELELEAGPGLEAWPEPQRVPYTAEEAAGLLASIGDVIAWAWPVPEGVDPAVRKFTPREVDEIAPGIARLVNKYEPLLRPVVERADEGAVALGLGRYVMRNLRVRREAAAESGLTVDEGGIGFGLAPDAPSPPPPVWPHVEPHL